MNDYFCIRTGIDGVPRITELFHVPDHWPTLSIQDDYWSVESPDGSRYLISIDEYVRFLEDEQYEQVFGS